ncbi:hypothetical protein RchiOBHm_Chr7g0216281 [Rosa chinensis]|uniref:Uncharacterized protein n=1 Tax=Rosa chinensis TaxID=74649 RepID=A0A2P6PBQ0_ROSCH|nr:hypothetical protein RchiOBHm_Chr7g0216281 [Rosa chinensis]
MQLLRDNLTLWTSDIPEDGVSLKLDFILFSFILRMVAFWINVISCGCISKDLSYLVSSLGCLFVTSNLGVSFDNLLDGVMVV